VHNLSGMNESRDSRNCPHSTCPQHSFAHEEQTEASQLVHSATAARPHRFSAFLEPYSIVQSDVIPVWIPASGTQFSVRYMLRKYETQSTVFCVAQIFMLGRGNTCTEYLCIPKLQKTSIGISRAFYGPR
jgi:hypothetical protein